MEPGRWPCGRSGGQTPCAIRLKPVLQLKSCAERRWVAPTFVRRRIYDSQDRRRGEFSAEGGDVSWALGAGGLLAGLLAGSAGRGGGSASVVAVAAASQERRRDESPSGLSPEELVSHDRRRVRDGRSAGGPPRGVIRRAARNPRANPTASPSSTAAATISQPGPASPAWEAAWERAARSASAIHEGNGKEADMDRFDE